MDETRFDIAALGRFVTGYGHNAALGFAQGGHGDDWVEMRMDWRADLIGDGAADVVASGPIVSLMDMTASMAVWARAGRFINIATLDLRIDYLRPARPHETVIGRGECYRMTRRIAFVRGIAHDGDAADPVAHMTGTFMVLDPA